MERGEKEDKEKIREVRRRKGWGRRLTVFNLPLIKEAAHFAFVYLTFKYHLRTIRYRLAVRAIGFGTLDEENSQTHLNFSSQV